VFPLKEIIGSGSETTGKCFRGALHVHLSKRERGKKKFVLFLGKQEVQKRQKGEEEKVACVTIPANKKKRRSRRLFN